MLFIFRIVCKNSPGKKFWPVGDYFNFRLSACASANRDPFPTNPGYQPGDYHTEIVIEGNVYLAISVTEIGKALAEIYDLGISKLIETSELEKYSPATA